MTHIVLTSPKTAIHICAEYIKWRFFYEDIELPIIRTIVDEITYKVFLASFNKEI